MKSKFKQYHSQFNPQPYLQHHGIGNPEYMLYSGNSYQQPCAQLPVRYEGHANTSLVGPNGFGPFNRNSVNMGPVPFYQSQTIRQLRQTPLSEPATEQAGNNGGDFQCLDLLSSVVSGHENVDAEQ